MIKIYKNESFVSNILMILTRQIEYEFERKFGLSRAEPVLLKHYF